MTHRADSSGNDNRSLHLIATAALAIGIFIADTFTYLEIAIPVLYVAVVLMAARFCQARGVLLVSVGCIGLTALSFLLSPPGGPAPTGVINTSISILTIGLTAFLVLRSKAAEASLRQTQADLAHVNRVTTMGEMTASLAHEVNQPIAAAVTNANTCLRWLAADTPNIEEARAAAMRIVEDGTRAAGIIGRIRLLFKKGAPERELVDVNQVIGEMIVLLRSQATRYSVSIRMQLAPDLPKVMGDRVQLQQVMMNLIMNSIDAMKDVDGTRDLVLQSQRVDSKQLQLSVSDTGVGLPPKHVDQIFSAFFTNKLHGTGMGLSISRSILESHGGHLWATGNSPRGASFYFTLPAQVEAHA
jgi:C4-dicarboxylate-specific signal transduction histidine kinase